MGFSPLGAFLSGFVLATSPRYWILARRCISDMTLCFFITCAMTCYFQARRDPHNTKVIYFLLFVLSLSGAFMTKGLVGLAIPLAALAAWRIVSTKPSLRDFMLLFAGGGVMLTAVCDMAFVPLRGNRGGCGVPDGVDPEFWQVYRGFCSPPQTILFLCDGVPRSVPAMDPVSPPCGDAAPHGHSYRQER